MKNVLKVLGSALLMWGFVFSANAAMDEDSIRERTKPVGQVSVEGEVVKMAEAAAPPNAREGSDIYQSSCAACHGTGVLDAPKFGDAAAWDERVAKGMDVIVNNAVNGINAMPARGTCAACSDDEIKATVRYILENSK